MISVCISQLLQDTPTRLPYSISASQVPEDVIYLFSFIPINSVSSGQVHRFYSVILPFYSTSQL